MKHFLPIAIVLLLAGLHTTAWGQSRPASIKVLGRAQEKRILLRWAPDNDMAWEYLRKRGVKVQRVTVIRDGRVLPMPEKVMLTPGPWLPAPAKTWQTLVDSSDYHAIAAQALYGEDFDLTRNPNRSVLETMNLSRQMELRFSFLLFAADQSFSVAKAAGLAWEDKTVKPGEKYLYRIFPATALPIKIDTGFVYIGSDDREVLPQPLDLKAEFKDRAAALTWDIHYHERIYNSYILEKSTDGGRTFQPVNKLPFVMTEPGNKSVPIAYKVDSLAENDKIYTYRVRGRTPFGELGPPSESVSGMGVSRYTVQVQITKSEVIDNKQVKLEWKATPEENLHSISHYSVWRANAVDGPYQVVKDQLKPPVSGYTDLSPRATAYYRVTAETKQKDQIHSFPVLVQLIDSIPPAMPAPPKGTVDSLGVVRLQWSANNEPDLLGYRVYKANFRNDEFSQVTKTFLKKTAFIDSINLKALDEYIYYKITAVDTRFNESAFSTVLQLTRPDVVPPVPPVFASVQNTALGVKLNWKKSSSTDAVKVILYRREGVGAWTSYAEVPKDSVSYTDTRVTYKASYTYKLVAVDDAGNTSVPSPEARLVALRKNDRVPINSLTALADRTAKNIRLAWDYPGWNDVEKFYVYKSQGGEGLTLFKSLGASVRGFADSSVNNNSSYTYRIKVIFKDGTETPFSSEVVVQY
ncbi:fibronectin type III domain-containing protein [Parachryseolinea silvisoli]|uniref:hypothetical protein n=1 Tax=Parachryseolinea silvisoli TaxID=2873601 RepID=UPI0022659F54|nr:hypothetical protein [Parachryseolinea silvisoli]MCD9015823.1 hypothetical protein [Parachryseolinea silvisoli]